MNYFKDKFSGVIITIIVQSLAIVWWASALSAQTNQNQHDITEIKQVINSSASITLTREQLNDILASRDSEIKSLNNNVEDFKTETRNSLSRIEQKLR